LKVFWSWQSDTPRSAGKDFIRECLDLVADSIGNDTDLDLPERPEIDQDTQDVAGTPEVVRTILEKIKSASVFIADVSFVNSANNGKRVPNPNVMLELGYAMHVLDSQQIILLMNLEQGGQSHLPFDLGMYRWPITYRLNRAAGDERRLEAQSDLYDALRPAIAASLQYASQNRRPHTDRNIQALSEEKTAFETRWLEFMHTHAARHHVLNWSPDSQALVGYGLRCTAAFSRPFTINDLTNRRDLRIPLFPIAFTRSLGQIGEPTDCRPTHYEPSLRAWVASNGLAGMHSSAMRHTIDDAGTISCEYFHASRPTVQDALLPIGYVLWISLSVAMMADYLRRKLNAPDAPFDLEFQLVKVGQPNVVCFFGVAQHNFFRLQAPSIMLPTQRFTGRRKMHSIMQSIQRDAWNALGATLRDEEVVEFNFDIMWQSQDQTVLS
jgi:hypothetical protein